MLQSLKVKKRLSGGVFELRLLNNMQFLLSEFKNFLLAISQFINVAIKQSTILCRIVTSTPNTKPQLLHLQHALWLRFQRSSLTGIARWLFIFVRVTHLGLFHIEKKATWSASSEIQGSWKHSSN